MNRLFLTNRNEEESGEIRSMNDSYKFKTFEGTEPVAETFSMDSKWGDFFHFHLMPELTGSDNTESNVEKSSLYRRLGPAL